MKNKLSVILLIVLIVMAIQTGCNTNKLLYSTFSMKEGVAQFSFEYSSKYKVAGYDAEPPVYVILTGPFIKAAKDYSSIGVTVWTQTQAKVWIHTKYMPNANGAMNTTIEGRSTLPDFKLIDQSVLNISGVNATEVAFEHRNIQPVNRQLDSPPIEVYRYVFFDYNNLIWSINIRSDSSTADTDKLDFDHVLQTFKILN